MPDVMYTAGHRCRFNDPDGEAAFCSSQNIRDWEHGDIVKILAFEIVNNERLPVCWNERTQTASSVVYECLTGPEMH